MHLEDLSQVFIRSNFENSIPLLLKWRVNEFDLRNFNIISVISGRLVGGHERLCAMQWNPDFKDPCLL